MSTRATYRFRQRGKPEVTIYIHHDGYPEGAAGLYLLPAIEKANGCLNVEAFIRANERAEITGNHEAHGDTEYRYNFDIDAGTVQVIERKWERDPEWQALWAGSIEAFVDKYGGEYRPGTKARQAGKGRWMTAEMAKAEAERKAREADDYAARFPFYTGNIDWHRAEAAKAAEFAAGFDQAKAA